LIPQLDGETGSVGVAGSLREQWQRSAVSYRLYTEESALE
jgi:hypothetical protein